MKNYKVILLGVFCLFFILSNPFADSEDKNYGTINENQPISIGESIYRNIIMGEITTNAISYIYAGYENNTIKINVMSIISSSRLIAEPKQSTETLSLPVNKKMQALLKVKTLNDSKPTREILITVVDNFYRLKAEDVNPG